MPANSFCNAGRFQIAKLPSFEPTASKRPFASQVVTFTAEGSSRNTKNGWRELRSQMLICIGSASAASVLAAAAQEAGTPDGEPGLAQSLRARGWTFPDTLPVGWSVTGTRWDDDERVLEIDLAGPQGTLVVTEQEGRLDTTALRGAERVTIGEHEAYVLSYAPWHVVWQCDSTVVQVVSGGDASAIVEAFPAKAFDGGVPARISRGWSTVAGAISRP